MAQPTGTRNSSSEPTKQPKLEQIEQTCLVTGKIFSSYITDGKESLPISAEGWSRLTDKQKYLINKGVDLQEVLNEQG